MSDRQRSVSSFWVLVGLIVGILIVGDLTRRMTDARRMQREADALAVEVAELEAANAELEENIDNALSDASVSEWARSQAKLVQEGERLVVPVPESELSPDGDVGESPTMEPSSPFEVWWALLFGG